MMRHAWLRKQLGHLIHDFEYDHRWQARFHMVAMLFWIANGIVVTTLFFLTPGEWVKLGVFYCVLISLYSNWDTDFDALSASQAAMHSQDLLLKEEQHAKNAVVPVPSDGDGSDLRV